MIRSLVACGVMTCYVSDVNANDDNVNVHPDHKRNRVHQTKDDIMTARRTNRKTVNVDIDVPEVADAPVAPARKYFSHANCDHARKGDEGKAARAACRNAHRKWFAAEAEYLAEVSVAV